MQTHYRMIIVGLLLGVSFVGCRSSDVDDSAALRLEQIEPRIKEVVKDPARRDQLQAILQEMARLLESEERSNAQAQQQLFDLHQSHSATREDFERVLTSRRDSKRAAMEQLLTLRLQAAEVMTPQEWSELVPK